MDKLLADYIKETGAVGVTPLCEDGTYGTVYEIQYGKADEKGVILPTGLPVLVFLRNGKVNLIPEEEAFRLLASLGEED